MRPINQYCFMFLGYPTAPLGLTPVGRGCVPVLCPVGWAWFSDEPSTVISPNLGSDEKGADASRLPTKGRPVGCGPLYDPCSILRELRIGSSDGIGGGEPVGMGKPLVKECDSWRGRIGLSVGSTDLGWPVP